MTGTIGGECGDFMKFPRSSWPCSNRGGAVGIIEGLWYKDRQIGKVRLQTIGEILGLYRVYIGIMEKKMETTIVK